MGPSAPFWIRVKVCNAHNVYVCWLRQNVWVRSPASSTSLTKWTRDMIWTVDSAAVIEISVPMVKCLWRYSIESMLSPPYQPLSSPHFAKAFSFGVLVLHWHGQNIIDQTDIWYRCINVMCVYLPFCGIITSKRNLWWSLAWNWTAFIPISTA